VRPRWSCPPRHRPAAGDASGAAAPDRRQSRPSPAPVPRSGQRAGCRASGPPGRPVPAAPAPPARAAPGRPAAATTAGPAPRRTSLAARPGDYVHATYPARYRAAGCAGISGCAPSRAASMSGATRPAAYRTNRPQPAPCRSASARPNWPVRQWTDKSASSLRAAAHRQPPCGSADAPSPARKSRPAPRQRHECAPPAPASPAGSGRS